MQKASNVTPEAARKQPNGLNAWDDGFGGQSGFMMS
jgi:hypothetical protein